MVSFYTHELSWPEGLKKMNNFIVFMLLRFLEYAYSKMLPVFLLPYGQMETRRKRVRMTLVPGLLPDTIIS